jgi:hypothetical protein
MTLGVQRIYDLDANLFARTHRYLATVGINDSEKDGVVTTAHWTLNHYFGSSADPTATGDTTRIGVDAEEGATASCSLLSDFPGVHALKTPPCFG